MLPDVYRIRSDTNHQQQQQQEQHSGAEVIKRELDEAKDHIRFVMCVLTSQVREHRYFLFKHRAKAMSWDMAEVKKVQGMDCVESVPMDMCRFGMSAVDDEGLRRPLQSS